MPALEQPNPSDLTGCCRLTPRQIRVLDALIAAPDWIERAQIDRIAGAANGPDIIMALRRKVTGHDGIDMERVERIDFDGRPSKPGRYRLNEIGRSRIINSCVQTNLIMTTMPAVLKVDHG